MRVFNSTATPIIFTATKMQLKGNIKIKEFSQDITIHLGFSLEMFPSTEKWRRIIHDLIELKKPRYPVTRG